MDVSIDNGSIRLRLPRPPGGIADGLVTVAVRPEALDLVDGDQGSHPDVFSASVEEVVFLGDHYQYLVRLGAVPLIVLSARETHKAEVLVRIPKDACTLMTPDSLAQLNGAGRPPASPDRPDVPPSRGARRSHDQTRLVGRGH
jgi:hypothetical protein